MTGEARAAIRAAYLDGATVGEIAHGAGVSVAEAETYLRWWCDRGCPGAQPEQVEWLRMENGWRCPFLGCHVREAHEHPICPDCGAVRYGNMFCPTCVSVRSRDPNPHRLVQP